MLKISVQQYERHIHHGHYPVDVYPMGRLCLTENQLRKTIVNKPLVYLLCILVLLSVGTFAGSAQQSSCAIDLGPIQTALANTQSAIDQGDTGAALSSLNQVRTLIDSIEQHCGGSLNWCFPGQPWGDGRCNAPDLTQDEMDWFWACGTYRAEHEAGLLDVVPDWCGYIPDSDGDGFLDDVDQCPNQGGYVDGNGCPACDRNVDLDCDGTPDGSDQCPNDPRKIVPGACGCGAPDGDGDGVDDCVDACPTDPNKSNAGVCGCGTPDTDTDADGTPDCIDQCPSDPRKVVPGPCGCGAVDSDGDGVDDCTDACPLPSDERRKLGDLCWQRGSCWYVSRADDNNGDGCLDSWSFSAGGVGCHGGTSGCP